MVSRGAELRIAALDVGELIKALAIEALSSETLKCNIFLS